MPEAVELPGRPVRTRRQGAHPPDRAADADEGRRTALAGRQRPAPQDDVRYASTSRRSTTASRDAIECSLDDLVVVAEFRDPIYPGLVSTGKVERGGDKPFHTVINAENYHALQTLLFTHRGKVDCDLHRPAVQHRREGLEVQQRLRRRPTTTTATRSGWRSWSGGCCWRRSC